MRKCYHWTMTKKRKKIVVGQTLVSKEFYDNETGLLNLYDGRVVDRRHFGQFNLYEIHYEDGDKEEMYADEVRECMGMYITRHR